MASPKVKPGAIKIKIMHYNTHQSHFIQSQDRCYRIRYIQRVKNEAAVCVPCETREVT